MNKSVSKEELQEAVSKHSVESLLPHSEPMVLIESISDIDDQRLEAQVRISDKSRFWQSDLDGVPAWVTIEYMAQAIAALAGSKAKALGEPVKLGFLLGTRKFSINSPVLESGKDFKVEVEQLYMDDSGLAAFDCKIGDGEKNYASAKLNVFEADDVQAVIST